MIQQLLQRLSKLLNLSVIPLKIKYILCSILLIIVFLSTLLLSFQYTSITYNVHQKLSSLVNVKSDSINSWIKDQIDDVNLLTNSEIFNFLFFSYISNPDNDTYQQLQHFLKFYSNNNDIKEILIVDDNFRIIFSTFNIIINLTENEFNYLKECRTNKKTLISDLHYDDKKTVLHLSVISPVSFSNTSSPSFYIICISDVKDVLMPILSHWTGNDESAETYLIEKRSKHIYKFDNKTIFPQLINFFIDTLPGDNFIYYHLNQTNHLVKSKDFYNNIVLSYGASIPEVSWIIISKQNLSILFGQWYIILVLACIILILSMSGLIGFVIIYTKNNEKLYYQKLSHIQNDQLKQFLQYKLMLESIGDAIIVTDNKGNIEIFNYIAELLTGWQYREVAGKYIGDVLNIFNKNLLLSDDDIFQSIVKGSFQGDYHTSVILSRNNTVIPVDFKGTLIKNNEENILGTIIIVHDRTKESFFHLLSEIRIRFINYAMQHTKDEFIHFALKSVADITDSQVSCFVYYKYYYNKTNQLTHILSPDLFNTYCVDDTIDCTIDYLKLWNECNENRYPIIHNSESKYFRCNASDLSKSLREVFIPVFINNSLVAILGVGTSSKDYSPIDISRIQILAEMVYEIQLHKEKEESYKNLVMLANDLACIADLNTATFLMANPAFEKVLGYTQDELLSKPFIECIHPDDVQKTVDIIHNELLKGNDVITFENRYRCKDGTYRWLDWNLHPVPSSGIAYAIAHDITERKTMEEILRISEEKFRKIFEHSNDGICLHELVYDDSGKPFDYRIVDVNSQYENILNLNKEDVIGNLATEVYSTKEPPYFNIFSEVALTGKSMTFETYYEPMDKYFFVSVFSPQTNQFVTVFKDITEQKKAEEERDRLREQLIQAQKLESIGRLAGGVAHDYNNMLEVILGNAQLALMQIDSKKDIETYLNEIVNAAKRSAEVTRQLLTFARKQITEPHVININQVIENMQKMLRRLIGENIELRWIPQQELWNVLIDPTQINQIVANLCINARDAINDNGVITVTTQNMILDENYYKDIPDCLPGEYVVLSVTDNGSGIDKNIINKIFEPFFTTKEVGKGTGLGLSTVYGIVKQNKGFINVYSEKGVGSTFKIYFPRYFSTEDIKDKIITDENPTGKGERLLVVEDEESLLKMIHLMLVRLQYNVITASTPSEAIDIMKTRGHEVDALLTDLVMPQMNGVELYHTIKQTKPDIACIFMSGYTDIMLYEHIINKDTNFLQKPFSMLELAKKLRNVLDKK